MHAEQTPAAKLAHVKRLKARDRVVGMRAGRIVFDGLPEQLTTGVAREIYGADASFSEAATSTEIGALDRIEAAEMEAKAFI